MPKVELIEIFDTSEESTVDWETAIADMVKRGAAVYCNSLQHVRKHCPRCSHLAGGLTSCHCGFAFMG